MKVLTFQEAIDTLSGWSYSAEQEFCVGESEHVEAATERTEVITALHAAVAAARERCAKVAEAASKEVCISPGCDCDWIATRIREGV